MPSKKKKYNARFPAVSIFITVLIEIKKNCVQQSAAEMQLSCWKGEIFSINYSLILNK